MRKTDLKLHKYYTHCEIDPSLIFGVMGNCIIYPETNQFPRNCFSCGQSRQAVSVYHSNYQMRMDKMGVILNYGQTPLIKSRYLEYINHEEQPYGVNAIVAIMSYTGYNVEDAILINQGSVDRGIFRTTYYTTYEAREESSKVSGSNVNTSFANIESKPNVKGIKDGFDYSKLDKYGLVQENTPIDDRVVLIGEVTNSSEQQGAYVDHSKTTKKGQLGFVDKSFMSEGEEGFRIAKVRIREERLPAIGDKMASRAGQKGTLGLIIPEQDMPFTSDGIRPDLIINPHAIPSRMTIGQLVECLFGKACCMYGGYGDCTAFSTMGANYNTYGHMLTKMGFHHSGNQLLYNGFTGEQIYSEIFIGPTYYMRLKHMVKDKINYRATGKRNFLTRQTNQGRANDGGLKIGEMERDGIMAHGLSYFLNESYMIRGDQYFMGICNKTGAIAIYNPDNNLFLSPFADGPLVFHKNIEGKEILNSVSKFGRSFSLVRVPFALKLLIQELQVMNIQMRIITEDNIDQLLNLSYQSRNIDKLLHIETGENVERDVKEIIENYKKDLDMLREDASRQLTRRYQVQNDVIPRDDSEETPETQETQESSLPYAPDSAIPETPDSVPYAPDTTPDAIPQIQNTEQKGGSNVFSNPYMNEVFNKLDGSQQGQILQLDPQQREIVMNEIIRRSQKPTMEQQQQEKEEQTQNPLKEAFEALPMDKQFVALQGGYTSMAKEFNQLAKVTPDPLVTIKREPPISQKIADEFPIFAVDKRTTTDKLTTTSDNGITDNGINDNGKKVEEDIQSNNSNIKNINISENYSHLD
jgi:hypothetical protein